MADIIVELDQQDHLEFDLKQEDQRDIDLKEVKAVVIGGIEYEEDPVDSGFVKYNAETEKYSTVAGDDTKLDKNTTVTSAPQIYAKNTDGTQTMLNVNANPIGSTIVQRLESGNIYVPQNPTNDSFAVPKKYADNLFNGANKAVSFVNYLSMITSLNSLGKTSYSVGQNIMIITLEVPDLWVSEIAETSVAYTYVSDDDFINELNTNGSVQVGYYKLSALETQKVDLIEYVKNTDYAKRNGVHGLVKISAPFGIDLPNGSSGAIAINPATNDQINNKTSVYRPIVPANFDYAMSTNYLIGESAPTTETKAPFIGALYVDTTNSKTYQCTAIDNTNNTYTWTQIIRATDYAGNSVKGVVDVRAAFGMNVDAYGRIYNVLADETTIAGKTDIYKPIVANKIDYAVKQGLAYSKLAGTGFAWTDEEKASARELLGVGEGGGLNIADLPKFTNKLYIRMVFATALAGTLTLPIVSSSNFVVDWGDGTTTDYVEAVTEISHTYADTSFEGWIYIYGDWKGIQFTSSSNTNKYVLSKVYYDINITTIPPYAFKDCNQLIEVRLSNQYMTINAEAFRNTNIYFIDLPVRLSSIPGNCFRSCSNLKKINIPSEVTRIYANAFQGTQGETDLIIPDNVTTIQQQAFYDVSNLKNIQIGNTSVCLTSSIGVQAFYTTNSTFDKVVLKTVTPPSLQANSFYSIDSVKIILVPSQSLREYKTGTNWSAFADKIYTEGGNYSETITIPASSWDTATNTVTVEAVGATSEDRNIITWNVSSGGVQVENTYGLKCTAQGTMSLTFSCETIPTEDVEVSVRYMLTNY